MEKEKNYRPSGDGHGDLPSPAEQLAIERNQRLRAEIERKEKEIAKMEVEIAKMEVELAKSQEEARQAELRVYALNTLIDVADETYGLGLRKVLGRKRPGGPSSQSKAIASHRRLIPRMSRSEREILSENTHAILSE